MKKERTLTAITGWATAVAVAIALVAGSVSLSYDCYGVANTAEPCLWAKSLFLVTSGMFFVIAWPICFAAGLVFSWWEDMHR